MENVIYKTQDWAITCSQNAIQDLSDGFYRYCDLGGCIDAPKFLPKGSTVENIVDAFVFNGQEIYPARRGVIGGLTNRDQ